MVPPSSDKISRVPSYSLASKVHYSYGAVTLFGGSSQNLLIFTLPAKGLFRVRSSLLAESQLISFPLATKIFQFARFASRDYFIHHVMTLQGVRFSHSETCGSQLVWQLAAVIVAYNVLHRLPMPRHPSNTLFNAYMTSQKCRIKQIPIFDFMYSKKYTIHIIS